MNVKLWKTCGYVCAKALDNLWINLAVREGGELMHKLFSGYPPLVHRLSWGWKR